MLKIVKNCQEELARAREGAQGKPCRAPHHTVSLTGLMGELAIAAGGVLWVDSAEDYRRGDLLILCNTWAAMMPDVRPTVIFALNRPDALRSRPDQPRIKVKEQLLEQELVAGAERLSARHWP